MRAVLRVEPGWLPRAGHVLRRVHLLSLDDDLLARAASLDPPELRSLDALHRASAALLGAELGVVLAYDGRLLAAARALGFAVASPGRAPAVP
jgi:uncharacterized protein